MSDFVGCLVLAGIVGTFMFAVVGWFVWAIQTDGWLCWFLEFGSWESIDKRYKRRGVERTLLHGELKEVEEVEEDAGERYLRKLQESEDRWAKHCRERAYERCTYSDNDLIAQMSPEELNAKIGHILGWLNPLIERLGKEKE